MDDPTLTMFIKEAKSLHINDERMIASWIYNKRNGKKYYTVKQLRSKIVPLLTLVEFWARDPKLVEFKKPVQLLASVQNCNTYTL